MRKIIMILAWIFIGIVGAHAGHFIYQKYYIKDFAAMKFSESMAIIFGRLLHLLLQFIERTKPLLIAHKQITLSAICLVLLMMLVFIWFKARAKSKPYRDYKAKIKEAEAILADAQKKSAGETEKIEKLRQETTVEFEEKEALLKKETEAIVADAQKKAAAEMEKIENLKRDLAAEFQLKERALKKETETILANAQKKAAEEMQIAENLKQSLVTEFEEKEALLKKETESILADARKKAAGEMLKIEKLKEKMTVAFEQKEEQHKQKSSERLGAYVVKISNLEKELLRLKEINSKLMQKLKTA